MKPCGCVALAALWIAGCAELDPATVQKAVVEAEAASSVPGFPAETPPIIEPPRPPSEVVQASFQVAAAPEPVIPARVDASEPLTPGPTMAPVLPSRRPGRPVASVGDDVITLPDLTEAVKVRLAELGRREAPNRRQMIAVTRSVLKAMIVHSLVEQEAREQLDRPGEFASFQARVDREWTEQALPALLRREGVTTELELRAKLARDLASPESLREEYATRAFEAELMRRDGSLSDPDRYLDKLRQRRTITSIMSPAELALAGKQAAIQSKGDD